MSKHKTPEERAKASAMAVVRDADKIIDKLLRDGGDVRFHIDVRVSVVDRPDYRLSFDFTGESGSDVLIRSSRPTSEADDQRLEKLATDFVGNIAEVIFKVQ